jgi:hypothetical protein
MIFYHTYYRISITKIHRKVEDYYSYKLYPEPDIEEWLTKNKHKLAFINNLHLHTDPHEPTIKLDFYNEAYAALFKLSFDI